MLTHLSADIETVIVAPLNWGLGHATRSIPVIKALLRQHKKVILASDGEALDLLAEAFPSLPIEELPGYKVRYKSDHLIGIALGNLPNILTAIIKENKVARQLVRKYQPDLIISDSRFGFRHDTIPSVIITHQLHLLSTNPLLKKGLNTINASLLNRFSEVWIPDNAEHKLSGILSQSNHIKNQRFIGPLSRLRPGERSSQFDLAIILSGPEPARTKLETQLINKYKEKYKGTNQKVCLIRGTKAHAALDPILNWTIIDRANASQVNEVLLSSTQIISRSGYTSIMDYAALGIGAQLIPTPGQSEQEYLAKYLDGKEGFKVYNL